MLLPCLLAAVFAQDAALAPRVPLAKFPIEAPRLTAPTQSVSLYVKFQDTLRVRAVADGSLASERAALAQANALVATARARCAGVIRLPAATLTELEQRAATSSGRAQPDLAGLIEVVVPDIDLAALRVLAEQFQALPDVEFAELFVHGTPPPGDIAPPTPSLAGMQTYVPANPGIGATYAHALGFHGEGLRISDCEYGWNYAHEDFADVSLHPEPGQTIHPSVYTNGWDEHGTAAFGEVAAVSNAYGCTGLASAATFATYTEWSIEEGNRRVTCIAHAIADSKAGDLVLLEMQTGGVTGYAPAEYSLSVWTVVKAGSDAGVVVIGAAGNGSQNLDDPAYAPYLARGDSGSTLVGAGSSNSSHSTLWFSTYGSRVNVQGWGENVFSLGYGGFAAYGGDKNQRYTSSFSGTSSASPIVTGAAALVQQAAKARQFAPLSPTALRAKLIATGVAQGPGGHIGPIPDVKAAIDSIPATWTDLGFALAGSNGLPRLTATGTLAGGSAFQLKIEKGKSNAPFLFVLGASTGNLAFKGGTLVPALTSVFSATLAGDAALTLPGTTPAGLPSAVSAWMQVLIVDPAAVQGVSFTNAVRATTP